MHRITAYGWVLLLITLCAGVSAEVASDEFFIDLATGKSQGIEAHAGNGNWLVVMIWASNCHVCNAEAKSYADYHTQNTQGDVRVIGVSMDGDAGRDAALGFVKRHALSFHNLIAEPGALGLYYGMLTGESLRGTPTFMVFDPDGKLVAAQAGAVKPEAITRFIDRQRGTSKTGSQKSDPG